MDKSENWVERLKISKEQLEAWKSEAPAELPLLVWCLKEGKISFPSYASWAKNFYELPVIHHDFFSKFEPPSFDDTDHWSPWMVPVSQWEGLTYVGCVVPPPDPEENLVYLIADPKDLEKVYAQMDSSETVDALEDTNEPPEMPQGLMLDLKPSGAAPEGLNLNLNFEMPPPPPQEEMEETSEEVPEIPDAPQGLSLSLDVPQMKPAEVPPSPSAPSEFSLESWWKECQPSFVQAVILEGSEEEMAVKWFSGKNFAGDSFSCSAPNIFRIVLRTKKPYHGFVVENDTHTQFFQSLGLPQYPPLVTALLVQDEDIKRIVVLYGFTGEAEEQLEKAQSLSEKLIEALSAAPQLNAA